ncbi:hypothetical protein AWM70_10525 [Paenibacillus yonginensis]|uniref:Uncharacterized protein n=1 Tax=Paenibacillus yonginensis TaxID=1462996 RepID=A0A1B1N0N2_9BACL|nr:hypothetical protein [Paenibacillus yonginensis]ANS74982.1 hypothetical protein AWM70_10525 [Paenibacillus yonginensis]
MSKLDGNERWKSKMLLTEHQEQYEQRRADGAKVPASRPTEAEMIMIRDYILLPYMLSMVEKSLDDMEHRANLLKPLYLMAGKVVRSRISEDLYLLRRELARRNIRVFRDEQEEMVVYHRFVCRGYEDRLGLVRDVVRAEISVRLTRYLKEMAARLTAGG